MKELEKPGRDPRDPFKVFNFKDDIFEVKDLKEGMICPGIVTNVTNFGAFVDIGVHQDGLVHISEIAHKFVDDPRKVVNPGDQVSVKVLKIDLAKNQIALSMKLDAAPEHKAVRDFKENQPRPARNDFKPRGSDQQRPSSGHDQRQDQRHDQRNRPAANNDQRNQQQRNHVAPARPAASPFNNPFAALLNQGNTKK